MGDIFLDFDAPFYGADATTTTLVPDPWPVSLNGRPYVLDLASKALNRQSVPMMRNQADVSNLPSEGSLSPEGYWRRAAETWHHGAGQTFFDRPESDPARFRSSKGLDVFEQWELTLLNDTVLVDASTATNLRLAVAGDWLYEVDGDQLYRRSSFTGPRTSAAIHVGETAVPVLSIASDGGFVYAALGVNGIHQTAAGTSSSIAFSDLQADLVGYVKGRLMAAKAHQLYNVLAGGAAPAAMFTPANTAFRWVGFAEGPDHIYAAGYAGDKSIIYRTTIVEDGTELGPMTVAGELPDGEVVRSIGSYLEFVLLGTDKGIRLAIPGQSGNLQIGGFIPTTSPVECFEGQAEFVWAGATNYDTVSTGLYRLDLRVLTGTAPAFASDLMATAQGPVRSVVTFQGKRVFAVAGVGIFAEADVPVPSGHLDSGKVTFGLPDAKVAMYVDVTHEPLVGDVLVSMALDGGQFTPLGTSSRGGSTTSTFPTDQLTARTFETRIELTGAGLATPVVSRLTLRAMVAPGRAELITLPLLLSETVTVGGQEYAVDVRAEYRALMAMETGGRLVTLQEGDTVEAVRFEDHDWRPVQRTADGKFYQGTMLVRLKRYEAG